MINLFLPRIDIKSPVIVTLINKNKINKPINGLQESIELLFFC